jgi:hypothetical protein
MKTATLKLWLYAVRVSLAMLALFWLGLAIKFSFLYATGGSIAVHGSITHTTFYRWPPRISDPIVETHYAYMGLVLWILVTWALREVHGFLIKLLEAKAGGAD